MEKYIEFDARKTMTKKAWREAKKANRIVNGFNTGERMFKDAKHPSRQDRKKNFQKELDKALAE